MANPIVIDLSHWNPTPDWATLKANGTVGVIHKATEGTSYIDDTLFKRAGAAMAAGLCWSTYHFLKHGNVEAQMAHYIKTIQPQKGERVCIDHEDADVTLEDLRRAVQYLLNVRPDLQITVYSGHTIKEQLGDNYDALLADNTSLWIAQYTTAAAPSWPKKTWPNWSLWQYTDKASVAGVSAPVDGNKWNGSPDNLARWFGPSTTPQPEPVPEPVAQQVRVAITAPKGVEVIIELNGELYTMPLRTSPHGGIS